MNRTIKTAGVLAAALLILLSGCSKKKSVKPPPVQYEWTILGYFDGNNSDDEAPDGYSYSIRDAQELEKIGSTDSVQILVMLGSYENDGDCKYYHIEKHDDEPQGTISSPVLQNLGKRNMSDYTALREFIDYGMENYPARHYMLIINDHGKGWRGLCSDEVNGGGDWMTLPELSSALSGFEFDIIWLYSPSMAAVEVAYQIKDRAEYMIASQYKDYPDNIMGSSRWLGLLTADPMTNVRLFANEVILGIEEAADSVSLYKEFHAALIHLERIPQLAQHLSNLGRALVDSTGSDWSEVWDAWESAMDNAPGHLEFMDLREFVRQIQNQPNLNPTIKSYGAAVEDAVDGDNGVVLLQRQHYYGRSGGICVHLPWNQDDFDSLDYAPLDFAATDWPEFISVFNQTYLGNYAGALLVTSNVSSADISIDGIDTGYETDALIEGLYPGYHGVHLDKAGYCHYETDPQRVFVLPRQTKLVIIRLVSCP